MITSFYYATNIMLKFTDLFKVNKNKVKTTRKSLKQKQPPKKQPLKKQQAVEEEAIEEETNILWPYLGILKTNHDIEF